MFSQKSFITRSVGLSLIAGMIVTSLIASTLEASVAGTNKPSQSKSSQSRSIQSNQGSNSNIMPGIAKPKASNMTPAYTAYVNKLRSKINSTWNYPDGKHHVVIKCLLSADGVVSDFQIVSTPQSAYAEEAANSAFNQAQPLDSLPGNTPAAHLTLTFDSMSSQHSSSSNLTTHLEPVGKVAVPEVTNP